MFIDEATIVVRSGDGGNGCVSFRREKYEARGGPDGGSGGKGGDVYLRVNEGMNTLTYFSRQRHFVAEDGGHGQGRSKKGKDGESVYVDVPPGTLVRDAASGAILRDMIEPEETFKVVEGGRGGRGNKVFKSSTRQSPGFAELGEPGKERTLKLELKLIADVGLLGKPNAGKSTLLASVSAAKPKIAAYPFTTLGPLLGVVEIDTRTFVMADIPGLIEGAHQGVGLGLQFLRHVERTRLLVHLLDGASEDPAEDYREINREIELYSHDLAEKEQIVVLNKMDLPQAREKYPRLEEELPVEDLYAISAVTTEGVRELMRVIVDRLERMPKKAAEEEELFVFRPHEEGEDRTVRVQRLGPGVFRLSGEEIERLAVMTDWTNREAMERFERIMRARGISSQLREAGVEIGDTVIIGDMELEWQ
ncbi:MAG: GTPase ObgE [Chloroflexota bacterium]|nr:GTPase ObgE [Chloroflexota bacterium]